MRINRIELISAVTFALILSGCLGGSGGGDGAALPPADNVLPAEVPDGSTAGIEDYLIPGSGTWQINLDGQVQTTVLGTVSLADALVYDPDSDQWTVNVDGRNFVLKNNGSGLYQSSGCITGTSDCVLFESSDDPAVTDYGVLGAVGFVDLPNLAKGTVVFVHAGLKTALADIPRSGTGTYAGTFEGLVFATAVDPVTLAREPIFDDILGTADIVATFTSDGGNVNFISSGTGSYSGSSYDLTGTATISGNTYQGTVTGTYDDGSSVNSPTLQLNSTGAGSILSGAFYGPDQIGLGSGATAGVVYATSAPGDPNPGELAGGFLSGQTGYTP